MKKKLPYIFVILAVLSMGYRTPTVSAQVSSATSNLSEAEVAALVQTLAALSVALQTMQETLPQMVEALGAETVSATLSAIGSSLAQISTTIRNRNIAAQPGTPVAIAAPIPNSPVSAAPAAPRVTVVPTPDLKTGIVAGEETQTLESLSAAVAGSDNAPIAAAGENVEATNRLLWPAVIVIVAVLAYVFLRKRNVPQAITPQSHSANM